jgi:hypothetical protein
MEAYEWTERRIALYDCLALLPVKYLTLSELRTLTRLYLIPIEFDPSESEMDDLVFILDSVEERRADNGKV